MNYLARLGTLAALLAALVGCSDGVPVRDEAGPPAPLPDGGNVAELDAGPAIDAGAAPSDAGVGDPGARFEGMVAGHCADGEDNDADGVFDCDDDSCANAPVCCVGSLNAMCCSGDSDDVELTLTGCDGTLDGCALGAGVTVFGTTPPVVEDSGLVPQGMPAYAGLALGDAFDLRGSRLDLTASIRVPTARCSDCVDAAGIALVTPEELSGALNYVRLGILVVGATNESILIVNGEVVDALALPDEELPSTEIALETTADGALAYTLLGGEAQTLRGLSLPPALVATVLGQNDNRPAGVGAISVLSATREVTQCDVPDTLVPRSTPVFPAEISDFEADLSLGRVSVVTEGGTRSAVVEVDGSLHALQANGFGEFIPTMSAADPGVTLLAGGGGRSFSAPWLEVAAEGYNLYYIETTTGNSVLVREFFPTLSPGAGETRTELLDAAGLGVDRVGAATHLGDTLIVELEDAEGTRLERFSSTDGDTWTRLDTIATPNPSDVFAFDRDAVGQPALIEQGGLLRLYYTGRRGTRRSIGLLVSNDGGWRAVGEVLAPSPQGFDSLQVSSPAPVFEDDADTELYYVGRAGSARQIGVARRIGTIGE